MGNETHRLHRQNTPSPSIHTFATSINEPMTGTSTQNQSTTGLNSIRTIVVDHRERFSLLDLKDKVRPAEFTAISPSGTCAAIVSKKEIRLFRISSRPSPIASGSFSFKRNAYSFGKAPLHFELQHPLPPSDLMKISAFTHIALSDEHLAIGAAEKVLIFSVSGERAGRCLFCDRIQNGMVRCLAFSPDGSKVVALYSFNKKGEEPYEAARFYPTVELENDAGAPVKSMHDISHCQDVTWPMSPIYHPRCMAFSWKGDMVGIATTYSEGEALIRILGENGGVWSHWGERSIKVNNADRRHEMVGWGVTGLSLYSHYFNFLLISASEMMNALRFRWIRLILRRVIAIVSKIKVAVTNWTNLLRSRRVWQERPT